MAKKQILNVGVTMPIPHDENLETKMLGVIIMFGDSFAKVASFFNDEYFFREENKVIAKSILSLHKKNIPIDLISVANECQKLYPDNLSYYVAKLTDNIPFTAVSLENYMFMLIEYYIRREVIRIGYNYIEKASNLSNEAIVVLRDFLGAITELAIVANYGSDVTIDEAIDEASDLISEKHKSDNKFYSVGIKPLDKILYLDKGDLVLLSGDAGAGKTKIITYMARGLTSLHEDAAVCWFTFEDHHTSIVKNMIASEVGISASQMDGKGYEMTDELVELVKETFAYLKGLDITFYSQTYSMDEIKSIFYSFCQKRPEKFNVLIIDNVMLLKDNSESGVNQTTIDDKIVRILKDTSLQTRKYNSAIFFLHHISKENKTSTLKSGYRLNRDNIKGSKRFIDVSTKVLLINRPWGHKDLVALFPGHEDMLEHLFIIESTKNRSGKDSIVRMFFDLGINYFKIIE